MPGPDSSAATPGLVAGDRADHEEGGHHEPAKCRGRVEVP